MARIGLKTDTVGGAQFSYCFAESQNFTINHAPPVALGDIVLSHYPFTDEHNHAHMVQATGSMSIGNKHLCRDGDAASCGHVLVASSVLNDT